VLLKRSCCSVVIILPSHSPTMFARTTPALVRLHNTQVLKRHLSGLKEAVIVSTARTPIGSFNGSLSTIPAPKLGAITIKAALERAGVKPEQVNEVIMGNVLSANLGQAPARQAALLAGLPHSTVCTTVNKVCASGMKAVTMAAQDIALGLQDVVVAGGMESMSGAPYYLDKARTGYKAGHSTLQDAVFRDGLQDAVTNQPMGVCGDDCASRHGITRKQQDEYAVTAYKRAAEATSKGYFKAEVVGVPITNAKGETTSTVTEDEEYKKTNFDKIPSLKPIFTPNTGSVTAANASKINDGAAALVIMSREKAKELGLTPLAVIRGYADAEQEPQQFPTTPALAIPKALKMAGLTLDQIDYFEVNEAFAVVPLANGKLLGFSMDKTNVWGGGVSLGHPIGASGARITASLVHILKHYNGKYGVAAICNGGGGATAIVIERL
jgi:acetyl-CoA C-acetyltransferase